MTRPDPMPHQYDGADWLAEGTPHRMLASDPGLGKTAMAIMAADKLMLSRILVLCPPVMRLAWEAEIERWQDFPRPVRVLSTTESVARHGRDPLAFPFRRTEWVVLGWAHAQEARRSWGRVPRFDALIMDEAHYAKNPASQRTRAVYGPQCNGNGLMAGADRVWGLTGTPVLNAPHELWSHYRALWPTAFGGGRPVSYGGFIREFCALPEGAIVSADLGVAQGTPILGARRSSVALLRETFAPFILRQRKAGLGLPTLRCVPVPLAITAQDRSEVNRLAREMGLFDATLAQARDVLGELDDVVHLATLRRVLGEAKAAASADYVAADLDGGVESAVVFAWHRRTMDVLEQRLSRFGVLRLDGEVSPGQKHARVERFQRRGPERVVVAQITAAGVGITLTRAADVYLVEQAWTPAENGQAVQRCHRLGQTAPVLARFLYAEGTVDAAVAAALARKADTLTQMGFD